MARILITGGAGFVGSNLARACLREGHQVHLVVRPGSSEERLEDFCEEVFVHHFDLHSETELRRCMADVVPATVLHLAASPRRPPYPHLADARESLRGELDYLISLLAAAAEARCPPDRLIRTGSLAEYGSAKPPYQEDMRELPVSVYGASVVAATHYVTALQSRLPFPVATARLALVYGPSQSTDYLLPSLIARCLAGETSILRRPSDRRDLIFVDDAVAALQRMAAAPLAPAAVINICSGVSPTMREVAELVLEHTGADPALIKYGTGDPPTGATDLCGSPELAQRLFGWRARTMLADGIQQTVRWYRDRLLATLGSEAAAKVGMPQNQALGLA